MLPKNAPQLHELQVNQTTGHGNEIPVHRDSLKIVMRKMRVKKTGLTRVFCFIQGEHHEDLSLHGGFLKWGGTPKSSICMGFSVINHPAIGGSPKIYGNLHIALKPSDREGQKTIC